ncbi:MAG TPA: carboxypeptidase-like regulatory domain-containing protein [Bryobacteraceae bacterium]|nr:carboxypeptidase-like regulatory domain-containing protein [Bryobacteraceae bacterium]
MRHLAIALPLFLFGLSLLAQRPGQSPAEKSAIEGRVTDAATGTVLGGVDILAYKDGARDAPELITTDASGHFAVDDLDPGRYRLVAQHNGYVTQQYGERARNREGIRIALAFGQKLSGVDFGLVPAGVVAGHVLGEGNEPRVGTTVAALSRRFVNGQQRLAIDYVALTNDLGKYRLFGIRPGRYYIAAFEPNRLGTVRLPKDAPPEERYGISFYPNAIDASKASSVSVEAGNVLNGADIYLVHRRTFHLRGRVSGVERGVQQVHVSLEPLLLGTVIDVGGQQVTPDDRGIFEFGGVLPGQYIVSADFTILGKSYRAWQPVEIEDSDVNNVFVMPNSGINVKGRMQFTEHKDLDLHTVTLTFHPTFSAVMGAPAARLNPDGSFTTFVSADIYNIEISALPGDSYVESIRIGDEDASDRVMDLSRFVGSWTRMDITLNANGASLDGAVENENHQHVAGATVLLAPAMNDRKQLFLFRAAYTDRNGRFTLHGIVPGEYKLLAWEDIEPGAWNDADFLSSYDERAEKITLQSNGHETRTLPAIPAPAGQ